MLGALLGVQHVLLHREANIVRLAGMGLSTDGTEAIRQIVPDSWFHEGGILRRTELLEPAHIRDDLGHTNTHMLKLTETEALAIRRRDADVGGVVEQINLIVLEGEILRRHDEAISEELQRHLTEAELTLEEFKERPATALTLVADGQEIERLGGILHEELHEGHNQKVIALSRLIAIQIEEEEDVIGELELLSGEFLRHREIQIRLESVEEDVNGTRDTLVLQNLLPIRGEGEDAVGVPIENVQELLGLHGIDLVAVDPDLEGPRNPRFPDFLQELRDDAEVIVNHDDVRTLSADYVGESLDAETLL